MDSYMEADYVMKFEVYDYNHDITKTHMIFIKEPDMKPHGCSTQNPSTIRAHVIIMKFLETIHDYFKTNEIRCRMDDIIDVLFNSAPGILRSPTINLINFDYNYKSNRYRNIRFILEDKQVCYNETLQILAVSDSNIQPYDAGMNPEYHANKDPHIIELAQKTYNDIQKYSSYQDDTNAWDTFLNEKKMERLHKDDDRFKYFIARREILDKIDAEDCPKLIQQYTAEYDSVAIQRGLILLTEFINNYNLENGHVDISIYKTNSNFINFTVIAVIVLSHDTNIEKWAVCRFK